MTDPVINPQVSPVATAVSSSSSGPSGGLSSDFETFLKMLTVQMENQDPLNPIESSDYAVQLATFSGVEQQVQTNELLAALTAQLTAGGLSEMAGWVGMEARANVPAYFDGTTPLTLSPKPSAIADEVQLVVSDEWGTEVGRTRLPVSSEPILWNGTLADGTPLPAGTYRFTLDNFAGGDLVDQEPVEVYTRISEVQTVPGGQVLVLQSGQKIEPGAVTALRS